MSTTLPELPDAGLIYMGLTGNPEHAYSADQMHAYGLAVWKAAIDNLVSELEPAAYAHLVAAREETDQRCKEWHAATAASYAAVIDLARALPLPEQGGPQ